MYTDTNELPAGCIASNNNDSSNDDNKIYKDGLPLLKQPIINSDEFIDSLMSIGPPVKPLESARAIRFNI